MTAKKWTKKDVRTLQDTGQPRAPDGEFVARFERMAVEDDRAADKCTALVARVRAEGLPAEVATFVPGQPGRAR